MTEYIAQAHMLIWTAVQIKNYYNDKLASLLPANNNELIFSDMLLVLILNICITDWSINYATNNFFEGQVRMTLQ